jgi:hypothetical protein
MTVTTTSTHREHRPVAVTVNDLGLRKGSVEPLWGGRAELITVCHHDLEALQLEVTEYWCHPWCVGEPLHRARRALPIRTEVVGLI